MEKEGLAETLSPSSPALDDLGSHQRVDWEGSSGLGPEVRLSGGLCCSPWSAGSTRVAELGLLASSWVPVGYGVSYRDGGPLLHQHMLRLWPQRGARGSSCSVSGFGGIPRWAGQGEAVCRTADGQQYHDSDWKKRPTER